MSDFIKTMLATFLGVVATVVGAWITQRSERRQQLWEEEIKRMLDLEERCGRLVEMITSYHGIEKLHDLGLDNLRELEYDAGRFRRHKGISQAIRDLHNGLSRLLDDKRRGGDVRPTNKEVQAQFDTLLIECDRVTGNRKM